MQHPTPRRAATGPRRVFGRLALLLTILTAVLLAGCTLAAQVTPPPGFEPYQPEPDIPPAPPSVQNGAEIYAANCTRCHGPNGLGDGEFAAQINAAAAVLANPELAATRSLRDYYLNITNGNIEALMPPWRDALTVQERWDVAAYAATLALPTNTAEQGLAVYTEQCAACHGPTGLGDGPDSDGTLASLADLNYITSLTGTNLLESLAASHDTDLFTQWTAEQQTLAVGYIRTLSFRDYPPIIAVAEQPADPTPDPETTAAAEADPETTLDPDSTLAAPAANTTTLTGRLLNGSTGSPVMAQPVTIAVFDNFQPVGTFEALTDEEGFFTLEDFDYAAGRAILVSTQYTGITYAAPMQVMEDPDAPYNFQVTVFDSTTDDTNLRVGQLVILIQSLDQNFAEIITLVGIDNLGQTSVVGTGNGTFTIAVPDAATNLEFETDSGQQYLTGAGFIALNEPIRPGVNSRQMLYSYRLPYSGRLNFSLPINQPVGEITVFIPEGLASLTGESAQSLGIESLQGTNYQSYSIAPPPAGNNLSFQVTPTNQTGFLGDANLRGLLIGVGSLLIAAAVAAFLITQNRPAQPVAATTGTTAVEPAARANNPHRADNRSRRERKADATRTPAKPAELAIPPRQQRDDLLDRLAELDDRFNTGELTEAAYQQQRHALKQQLIHLLQTHNLPLSD